LIRVMPGYRAGHGSVAEYFSARAAKPTRRRSEAVRPVAIRRATMKLLQLTAIVRDVQTGIMTAHSFTRSPVLVGRQYGNQLRLDAAIVSRRHGAFLFSKDGLEFIDYASANGTLVDGVRCAANMPTDIRAGAVLTIAPFQIVAHLDLVDTGRLSNDPNAETPMVVLLRPRLKSVP